MLWKEVVLLKPPQELVLAGPPFSICSRTSAPQMIAEVMHNTSCEGHMIPTTEAEEDWMSHQDRCLLVARPFSGTYGPHEVIHSLNTNSLHTKAMGTNREVYRWRGVGRLQGWRGPHAMRWKMEQRGLLLDARVGALNGRAAGR